MLCISSVGKVYADCTPWVVQTENGCTSSSGCECLTFPSSVECYNIEPNYSWPCSIGYVSKISLSVCDIGSNACGGGTSCTPGDTISEPACVSGNGLWAKYYAGNNFQDGLKAARVDSSVDFNWGDTSPIGGLCNDYFSIRWDGYVAIPTAGTWNFYTETDDGARLWVNNQQIINRWEIQPTIEWSGSISLNAGVYPIRMEYFDDTGGASARLRYEGPGVSKQIIPSSALYTSCTTCDDSFGSTVASSCSGSAGVWARYLEGNNPNDTNKIKINRTEGSINHLSDWGSCPVDCNLMGSRNYSIKYSGYFLANTTGVYRFKGATGTGTANISIGVGGSLLNRSVTNSASTCEEWSSFSVTLTRGWYPYTYTFTQSQGAGYPTCGGTNCITLQYSGPDMGSNWQFVGENENDNYEWRPCDEGCSTLPGTVSFSSATTNPPACTFVQSPTWVWNGYTDPQSGKCPILKTEIDRDWIAGAPDNNCQPSGECGVPYQQTSFTPTGQYSGQIGLKVRYTNKWGAGNWSENRQVTIDTTPPVIINQNQSSNYMCLPPSNAGTAVWSWNVNNPGCAVHNLSELESSWGTTPLVGIAPPTPPSTAQSFTAGANMVNDNFVRVRARENTGTESNVYGGWVTFPSIGIDDDPPQTQGYVEVTQVDQSATPQGEGIALAEIYARPDVCYECDTSMTSCAGLPATPYVIKLTSDPPQLGEWSSSRTRTFSNLVSGNYIAYMYTRDNYDNISSYPRSFYVPSQGQPTCTITGVPNVTNYGLACNMSHNIQLTSASDPQNDNLRTQVFVTNGSTTNNTIPATLFYSAGSYLGVPSGFTWIPGNTSAVGAQVGVRVSDDNGVNWVNCLGTGSVNVNACTFDLSLAPQVNIITAGQTGAFTGTITENVNWPNPINLSCLITNSVTGGSVPTCSVNPLSATPDPSPTISNPVNVNLNVTNTNNFFGDFYIRLQGSSSGQTKQSNQVTLSINNTNLDYGVNITEGGLNEPSISFTQGSNYTVPVNITENGNWTDLVNLTCSITKQGGGAVPNCAVSPTTGTPVFTTNTTISNTATHSGTYTLTVTGTSAGRTRLDTATFTINTVPPPPTPSCSIALTPISNQVNQGSSTSYAVNVTGSGGFTSPLTLSTNNLTANGITFSWAGGDNIANYSGTAYQTLTLNVSATGTASPITHDVIVNGVSGGVSCTGTASLGVNTCGIPPQVPQNLKCEIDTVNPNNSTETHRTVNVSWDENTSNTSYYWLLYKTCVNTPGCENTGTCECNFNGTWTSVSGPQWTNYCQPRVRYPEIEPDTELVYTAFSPSRVKLIGGWPRVNNDPSLGCMSAVQIPFNDANKVDGTKLVVRVSAQGSCNSGYSAPVECEFKPGITHETTTPVEIQENSTTDLYMQNFANIPTPFQNLGNLTFNWSVPSIGSISFAQDDPTFSRRVYNAPDVPDGTTSMNTQLSTTLTDSEGSTSTEFINITVNNTPSGPPPTALGQIVVKTIELTDETCNTANEVGPLEDVSVSIQELSPTEPPIITQQSAINPSSGDAEATFNNLEVGKEFSYWGSKADYISCSGSQQTQLNSPIQTVSIYFYRPTGGPHISINQGNFTSMKTSDYACMMPSVPPTNYVVDENGSVFINGIVSITGNNNYLGPDEVYQYENYQDRSILIDQIFNDPPESEKGVYNFMSQTRGGTYSIDSTNIAEINTYEIVIVPGNLTITTDINTIEPMLIIQNDLFIENNLTQPLTINGEVWVGGNIDNSRSKGVKINAIRKYIQSGLLNKYAIESVYWIRVD